MRASEPHRLSPSDSLWPAEFQAVEPAPLSLWLRGRTELMESGPRVAIVGTRSPTPYGESQARRFAGILARAGVCIVSGLARGIDACAHEAALDAGGLTIAVLGCGVDRPWPAGPLAERVAEEGLLLSEYEPGRAPRRHHFPLRNRLISGLAQYVIVIEAAYASGSLITARWAADQGRDVLALPGRVDHPMARGCHRLIREGAQLIGQPAQLLEELGLLEEADLAPAVARESTPELSAAARRLLGCLQGETLLANELAERCSMGLDALHATLVGLELSGAVVRGPGGLYRLPH